MHTRNGTQYSALRALVAGLETDARHCRKVAGESRFLGHLLSRSNPDRALSYLLLARAFASVARELGKGHRHPLGVIDANTQRSKAT